MHGQESMQENEASTAECIKFAKRIAIKLKKGNISATPKEFLI